MDDKPPTLSQRVESVAEVTGDIAGRVAALETSHDQARQIIGELSNAANAKAPDGLENAIGLINKYGPLLEELAEVADRAKAQGHTWSSVMGAVGQQLLGIFLHRL